MAFAPTASPPPALSLVASGGPEGPSRLVQRPRTDRAPPTSPSPTTAGLRAPRGVDHLPHRLPGRVRHRPAHETDYAYYASKSVLLDDGTMARTGVISLGAGHADHRLGVRGAIQHYDSTSAAVADVSVGEDEHGIWCAGWIRPGTTDEQVYALRASDVSGDWREVGPDRQEMVAALAVNVAGLPVVRVRDGVQVSPGRRRCGAGNHRARPGRRPGGCDRGPVGCS